MEEWVNLEIESLVYGGSGLGRLQDGKAAFVPSCLPGEKVRVKIVENRRGHVKTELVEVLNASPKRIQPRCKHFGICGGCHYQHLSYTDQLYYKQKIVIEQLQRIGGVKEPCVLPITGSPEEWNYRNAIQFHIAHDGRLGFQMAASNHVIPIEECFLPENLLGETWPKINIEATSGIQRVDLRGSENGDVLLILESNNELPGEFQVDFPISVVHLGPEGPFLLAGEDFIVIRVLDKDFKVSARSFFQVNARQAAAMVKFIMTSIPFDKEMIVFDVYCGVGLFSAFIAEKVKKCIGIEISESACEDYAVNLDSDDNVELFWGEAEKVLPELNGKPDTVILDPPRSGLLTSVIDCLCQKRPKWIVYVSCDPSTLARDIRKFIERGYAINRVAPFDLFPQTFHIETIIVLTPAGK